MAKAKRGKRSRSAAEPKRGRGRPKAVIPVDQLRGLAQIHCTVDEAAGVLGINVDTLYQRMKAEPELKKAWEDGRSFGRVSLRRLQWRHASGTGNSAVTMTVHLAKHWLGETERSLVEHTGKDGQPIQHGVTYVVETPPVSRSAEEWQEQYRPPTPPQS